MPQGGQPGGPGPAAFRRKPPRAPGACSVPLSPLPAPLRPVPWALARTPLATAHAPAEGGQGSGQECPKGPCLCPDETPLWG